MQRHHHPHAFDHRLHRPQSSIMNESTLQSGGMQISADLAGQPRGRPVTLSSLFVFALALLITAGSPSPSVAALVARVLTHGLREVLPFLIAMRFGEALWLTCAVTGLAVLAHQFALAFLALKFAGIAYLLFLAAAATKMAGAAVAIAAR
jgi:hypothetical protein